VDYFRDFVPKTITLPNPDPFGRAQEKIVGGDKLFSATQAFVFSMAKNDGDLTLSVYDEVIRQYRQILSLGTAGASALLMQDDGNLVAYDAAGKVFWDSARRWNYNLPQPKAFFRCQDDGNLVVYASNGAPLGYSGTFAGGRTGPVGPAGWGLILYPPIVHPPPGGDGGRGDGGSGDVGPGGDAFGADRGPQQP
jgi:hypothetical protein